MKKLLISAFVASMFVGSHAFAGENIPLAAALGTGAAVTVAAAGALGTDTGHHDSTYHPGTAPAFAGIVAAAIVVASEAGGTSTATHH